MASFPIPRFLPLAGLLMLAGCNSLPSAPEVLALPGTGKTLEQFRNDDAGCRQYAAEQIDERTPAQGRNPSASGRQRRYDFAYVQCMYARGHRVPVIGRSLLSSPSDD